MSHCTIVVFLPPVPCSIPALLALFCGCSGWAGWEAPDWLQAVPLPGLTSRHCFCPLNRINKSMCQVDCSQETMTQFWHHCPPNLSPSPPPSASLQLLIKKTLLSWRYALPWGCLTALFPFFYGEKREVGAMAKIVRWTHVCPSFLAQRYACCGVAFTAHLLSDQWIHEQQMLHPGVSKLFQGKSHDVIILVAVKSERRLFPARVSWWMGNKCLLFSSVT